jgi:hypothetical protein
MIGEQVIATIFVVMALGTLTFEGLTHELVQCGTNLLIAKAISVGWIVRETCGIIIDVQAHTGIQMVHFVQAKVLTESVTKGDTPNPLA